MWEDVANALHNGVPTTNDAAHMGYTQCSYAQTEFSVQEMQQK